MTRNQLLIEISKLSLEDREILVREIWEEMGKEMGYFEDLESPVNTEIHLLKEEKAEYRNDPAFKFWKEVHEKLEEPYEISQEVKDLLDERMAAYKNGTAVLIKWEDLKTELEKRYKNEI